MTLQEFLQRLDGARKQQSGWTARCPGHDDDNPSLSVDEGKDGRILVTCRAGCETRHVLTSMGLAFRDLYPKRSSSVSQRKGRARLHASREDVEEAILNGLQNGGDVWDLKARHAYTDVGGRETFRILRFQCGAAKTFRPVHPTDGGWKIGLPSGKRHLYRLADVLQADEVYIVEGEKDVDAAIELGLVATTSACGAKAAKKTDWSPLRGKQVWILPDQDEAGESYSSDVARELLALDPPAKVGIKRLPDLEDGQDLSDFILKRSEAGAGAQAVLDEIRDVHPENPVLGAGKGKSAQSAGSAQDSPSSEDRQRAVNDVLRAASGFDFFRGPEGDRDSVYVAFEHDGHQETWPIQAQRVSDILRVLYENEYGTPPPKQALLDAIEQLRARGSVHGERRPVGIRVLGHEGKVYLDLGTDDWMVVEIDCDGWRTKESAEVPVHLYRRASLRSLPLPERGGILEDLRPYLNITTDDEWRLVAGFLIGAISPRGPYPILVVEGEHGSAKTSLCRYVISIIDPKRAALRRPPKDERDLMISASNSWVLGYDNISGLSPMLSDAICTLSTGGGFSTRKLHSDDEEILFEVMRPVVLNGIDNPAARPDLLDRAIVLQLRAIPDADRKDERDLDSRFEGMRGRILGGLLDSLAGALKRLPETELAEKPRLADFALLVTAAEEALGWEQGAFLRAFTANRLEANLTALEGNVVGAALLRFMGDRGDWSGTFRELHEALKGEVEEEARRHRYWPKRPQDLGRQMRRIRPLLVSAGISMEDLPRSKHGMRIRLSTQNLSNSENLCTLNTVCTGHSDAHSTADSEVHTTPDHVHPRVHRLVQSSPCETCENELHWRKKPDGAWTCSKCVQPNLGAGQIEWSQPS